MPFSAAGGANSKPYPEYKCRICGKRYRILGNYERHMLLKHVQN